MDILDDVVEYAKTHNLDFSQVLEQLDNRYKENQEADKKALEKAARKANLDNAWDSAVAQIVSGMKKYEVGSPNRLSAARKIAENALYNYTRELHNLSSGEESLLAEFVQEEHLATHIANTLASAVRSMSDSGLADTAPKVKTKGKKVYEDSFVLPPDSAITKALLQFLKGMP